MRALLASFVFAGLLTGLAFAQSDTETQSEDATSEQTVTATPVEPSAEGLAAWGDLFKVFSHPRCINCHTPDEYPRWSGPHYGDLPKNHGMNVKRGSDGFGNTGLRCQTCHAESNSAKLHGPPGAPHWHLAPQSMVWWGKSTSEICAQIKDPARNGDRSLQDIADHIRKDPLVAWGWNPGKGREPAPGSAEETFTKINLWIAEGAPCPE